jgi:hypothetical protein
MGNLTGQFFKDYVAEQIDVRQKKLGAEIRNTQAILQQNSKSAWIKLTSGIEVVNTDKFGFQQDIAKKYALFGGTSKDGKTLGGLNAYTDTQFGYEQGYRPAPGITSFETKNRNRGSIRESTIQIKAYNRAQFELIDILYLRLGYSVLIEFGNSLYYDNAGNFQQFTDADTLTSAFLDTTYEGKQASLLADIEKKRAKTGGNYDAIFGRISNFNWSFTTEGTYDISVTIMSYGDVIEALKENTQPEGQEEAGQTAEEKEKKEKADADAAEIKEQKDDAVIYSMRNSSVLGKLFHDLKTSLQTSPGAGNPNCCVLSTTTPFTPAEGYNLYDAVMVNNTEGTKLYYIRFGALLKYMWERNMIYIDQKAENPLLVLDNDVASNLIYKSPYTLSANPNICIVKTYIELNGVEQDFSGDVYPDLPEEGRFNLKKPQDDAGQVMNVYVNTAYILKTSLDCQDSSNKTAFSDLLNKIIQGIQSALGGQNKLEITVDAEEARVYVLDEVQIPSLDPGVPTKGIMKVYGVQPGTEGSFVTDFGIKTEITNELASIITIGAQANGSMKGEDATAFSSWNEGLLDRIIPYKSNYQNSNSTTGSEATSLNDKFKNIQQEYINYITSQTTYAWDAEKVTEFPSILTNMITFSQTSIAAVEKKATGALGFIPINLNLTFEGMSGMKIYNQFVVESTFLPKRYGQTLKFLIKGISHKIENNRWLTSVDTVVVPTSVIVETANQSFSGVKATPGAPAGTAASAATPSGKVSYPAATPGKVRLRLRRQKETSTGSTGITEGILEVLDANGKVLDKKYTTVELPWRGNQNSISCIPPGKYNFVKSRANNNPGLGEILRLSEIPGRSGVLVHIGNKAKDTHGCILPRKDKKGGGTEDATKDLVQYFYPAGAPNTTYSLEVYGISGQAYVGTNGVTYANPGTTPPPSKEELDSKKVYLDMTDRLVKILNLKDALNKNTALLKDLKAILDDNEKLAVQRINQTFGIIAGPGLPWTNKEPVSRLIAKDKKLFVSELKRLTTAILNRDSTFSFKTPSSPVAMVPNF